MDDIEYFRRRLHQEEMAARRVQSPEAALIHRTLAAHYARLALVTLMRQEDEEPDRSSQGNDIRGQ